MKDRRPSLLTRAWRKLFPAKEKPSAPVRLASTKGKPVPSPASGKTKSSIEPLEGRIAPATLLPGGKALKYTDSDGDVVTITFSKAIFAHVAPSDLDTTLDSVFQFSAGDAHSDDTTPQQLQLIDLAKVPAFKNVSPAAGLSMAITDVKSGGDGFANIGGIEATGLALGSISVQGDLGYINAGVNTSAVGLASLKVVSLGVQTTTQAGATPNYTSTIVGKLGSFTADEVLGAYLNVTDGLSTTGLPVPAHGVIGSVNITHFLEARTLTVGATGSAPLDDGVIQAQRDIGSVKIGSGNSGDGLVGGWGTSSGSIIAGGSLGSATIDGNIAGGPGSTSGAIRAIQNIGSVTVNGDITGGDGVSSGSIDGNSTIGKIMVAGDLVGGTASRSGSIDATGHASSIFIAGGITGGTGATSGSINGSAGIDKVTVMGNITAGSGANSASSGSIDIVGNVTSLTFDGDLTGGDQADSGSIKVGGAVSTVNIHGNFIGGAGATTGALNLTSGVGKLTMTGNLTGGAGTSSGAITTSGSVSSISFSGNLVGGAGDTSGAFNLGGATKALTINGNLTGGAGTSSGSITAAGDLGTVLILGDVVGGDGDQSGTVHTGGNLKTVTIGTAANPGLTGGGGDDSGVVSSVGTMGTVTIIGNIVSGVATGSPLSGASYSGGISAEGKLSSVIVKGSIQGGNSVGGGFIEAKSSLGSVNITGNIIGGSGVNSGTVVSAGDFKSLTVGSSIEGGSGQDSGSVFAATSGVGTLGSANVGNAPLPTSGTIIERGLVGNSGQSSGSISSGGSIGSIVISGVELDGSKIALSGGTLDFSGSIYATGAITSVKINGDMEGGSGISTAAVEAHGLGSFNLVGNAIGGMGALSASVTSFDSQDFSRAGNIGKVVGGNFIGGTGANSAQIRADGTIGSVQLAEMQAAASTTGTPAVGAGSIFSGMGSVAVGTVGSITLGNFFGTIVTGGRLGALNIHGDVVDSTVHVGNDLGSLNIQGDVTGSTFTALGQAVPGKTTDVAFGKITISKNVTSSNFEGGYDFNGAAVNGDAQIGAVAVGGSWSASNLVTGVVAGPDGQFGTPDDAAIDSGSPTIVSKIASIVIDKTVDDGDGSSHYGFVAEALGSIKVNNAQFHLTNGSVAVATGVTALEVPTV